MDFKDLQLDILYKNPVKNNLITFLTYIVFEKNNFYAKKL